jgi:hypothetical protein
VQPEGLLIHMKGLAGTLRKRGNLFNEIIEHRSVCRPRVVLTKFECFGSKVREMSVQTTPKMQIPINAVQRLRLAPAIRGLLPIILKASPVAGGARARQSPTGWVQSLLVGKAHWGQISTAYNCPSIFLNVLRNPLSPTRLWPKRE